MTCPNDIVFTITTGEGGSTIDFDVPTAIDNSGVANQISQTATPGSFFGLGETSVTYRFADNSGNVGSCTFIITITDGKTIIIMLTTAPNMEINAPNVRNIFKKVRILELP